MTETIGFIGIGSQGGPIAHRIAAAGMPLMVWARRPEAMEPYAATGVKTAGSVAELGGQCDHVGICVVSDADVFQVADLLLPAMKVGSRIAIHSTIMPESVIRLERQCADKGIALIDAPVSGGQTAANVGELTVMCGGNQETFDAALPVFRTFGKFIVLLGAVGAGQRAKLINNAILSANLGAAMAGLEIGQAFAMDRKALVELIQVSSGRSYGFETYARLPSPTVFGHGAKMLSKDINLLKAALPDDENVKALGAAADPFLAAALLGRSE